MGVAKLGGDDVLRFGQLLRHELRTVELPAPLQDEKEPQFTGRVLQPLVGQLLERLDIAGMVATGDGSHVMRPVRLLGEPYYPDLGVMYHDQKLAAVEVKYLRQHGRQAALATGLGQAVTYRGGGYPMVLLLLLDLSGAAPTSDIAQATDDLEHWAQVGLVVRKRLRNGLLPHPQS